MPDLTSSQNPVPQHLPKVLPDLVLMAPFLLSSTSLMEPLGEAGQIPSTLACLALLASVAGRWAFSCALYFRHTQTLCSCCQKETKTVPAFWQIERRGIKASWASSPALPPAFPSRRAGTQGKGALASPVMQRGASSERGQVWRSGPKGVRLYQGADE